MDYETPKSTMQCAKTQRPLNEGEAYWSVLLDRGNAFQRVDYSDDGWEGPPEGALCVWRTRVPVKEEQRRPLVDPSVMLEVFTRLETETEPSKIHFRYILALLLMRKRILKLTHTDRQDDAEYLVFTCRRTESEHRVLDPHLTESQITSVQEEVGRILNTDV